MQIVIGKVALDYRNCWSFTL